MSEELVKIGEQGLAEITNAFNDAFEVNFKEVRLSPFLITIDQPMTQHPEGVTGKPGYLRTQETGELRKSINAIVLAMPTPSRKLQTGKYPNQKLVCFSRDMERPDKKAPHAQAMLCSGCQHASWEVYNETHNADDAPPCKITDRVWFLDIDNLVPAQMYIQGKGRQEGLQTGLDRLLKVMQAYAAKRGGKTSWVQFRITITTEKYKDNPNYAVRFVDPKPLTDEEAKRVFAAIQSISARKQAYTQAAAEKENADAAKVAQTQSDEAIKKAAQSTQSAPPERETPPIETYEGSEEI